MKNTIRNCALVCNLITLTFLFATSVIAQVSDNISEVRIGDAKEKNPISIVVNLISVESISNIDIAYKEFGESEYTKSEMLITGNSAIVTIPPEVAKPPLLEYYFIISLKDGSMQTFPIGVNEGVAPFQLMISTVSNKDKEIMVLSPDAGENVKIEDLLISISFIKAPDTIDVAKTKIFLNNIDISSSMLLAGDLILLSGENLGAQFKSGAGIVRIEAYDKDGNLYHTVNQSFNIVSFEVAQSIESLWKYSGNIKGESRNESFNSSSTWFNNLSTDLNASASDWRFNAFAFITSEEKSTQQPYNRYFASVKNGDWLDLRVGDAFPRFPNLILDGRRIRGFNGSLNLGAFNIQVAYGESVRKVEGNIIEKYNAGNVPLGSDIIPIDMQKYGSPYARVRFGTFNRQIFAVRPSFGSGQNFQLGFSYLHAKDDPGSIDFGVRPQENVVIGTDLKIAADDQNILFTTQAALSIINKDIASGTLTDAQIDSIFSDNSTFDIDPKSVKDIRDIIDRFITVNQYLGPWNPQELASFAGESALSLNYFNNSLRASYIYRGNEYQSFGQSFIRTDVKGLNIQDRIRMFDNRVFLAIGYEELKDNLQKTKISTITYKTYSASLSLFPRADFPNITIGFNRYQNANELKITDPKYGIYAIDDLTNRFLLQLSYDIDYLVRHSTSLSFTTSSRDDNSLLNNDASFNTGSFAVNSFWTRDLSSNFGLLFSSSEIAGIPFSYFTINFGGRYRLLENKLLLSANFAPSFGDFERQTLELLADYNILANLNLGFQARIFRIPGSSTNSIIGLTTRLTI
jgi:hypothetical protein